MLVSFFSLCHEDSRLGGENGGQQFILKIPNPRLKEPANPTRLKFKHTILSLLKHIYLIVSIIHITVTVHCILRNKPKGLYNLALVSLQIKWEVSKQVNIPRRFLYSYRIHAVDLERGGGCVRTWKPFYSHCKFTKIWIDWIKNLSDEKFSGSADSWTFLVNCEWFCLKHQYTFEFSS